MPIAPLFGGSQPSILWEHDRYKSNLFRIPVLDLPSRQWIAALEAYEYNIEQICDAALSPDGTLLALFRQEGIVEVYPQPASTAAPPGSQVK
jgi:hypothetical protein